MFRRKINTAFLARGYKFWSTNIFTKCVRSATTQYLRVFIVCIALTVNGNVDANSLNSSGRDITLQSPVLLNGQEIGFMEITISKDSEILLDSTPLGTLLSGKISEETLPPVLLSKSDEVVTLEALANDSLSLQFDMSNLVLDITASPGTLSRKTLGEKASAQEKNTDLAEGFSNFTNMGLTASANEMKGGGTTSRQTFQMSGMARFYGPVLQYELGFLNSDDGSLKFGRRGTRVLYDLPKHSNRLTIGDIQLGLFGLNPGFSANLLGIGLDSAFDLNPEYSTIPRAGRQFELDTSATVTVLINGITAQTYQLSAGAYDLRDIAVQAGFNNVELLIEKDNGTLETLSFDFPLDLNQLAKGEVDYAFAVGILAEPTSNSVTYIQDKPVAVVLGRYGINATNTASLGVRLAEDGNVLTADWLHVTSIGAFFSDVGFSQSEAGQVGESAGFRYANFTNSSDARRKYTFEINYASTDYDVNFGTTRSPVVQDLEQANANFGDIIPLADPVESRIFAAVGFSVPLRDRLNFNSSLSTVRGASEQESTFSASMSGVFRLARGVRWGVSASYSDSNIRGEQSTISLRLSFKPSPDSTGFSQYSTPDNEYEVGYRVSTLSKTVGSYSADFSASGDDESEEARLEGKATYLANRFRVSGNRGERIDSVGVDEVDARTVLRFETAAVFAGGVFAISQPVAESFAIFKAHKSLGENVVRVSPSENQYVSRSTWFGPAVLPALGRYRSKKLSFSVEDLPVGYDLGAGYFQIKPPLGAGYSLTVGSDARITVIGILIESTSGTPIDLISGVATPLDGQKVEPIEFFTNRSGKFALSGATTGRFLLEIRSEAAQEVEIEIPDSAETFYRIGDVRVP